MKSNIQLNYEALKLRKDLGLDSISPIDIFSIVKRIEDLTIVFYPMGKNISGMCYKDIKLIVINSDHSYGRSRFTLAHELYHYYFDENVTKKICINQDLSLDDNEKEANLFASYFLAPYDSFKLITETLTKQNITVKKIIELEQYYGMSRQAILFRLKEEGIIDSDSWDKYSKDVIINALRYGYDDKLYRCSYINPITYGRYISLVEELYDKELITNGKKNELLLSAFRSDMVYGEINEEICETD